jgi:hypothetical protein
VSCRGKAIPFLGECDALFLAFGFPRPAAREAAWFELLIRMTHRRAAPSRRCRGGNHCPDDARPCAPSSKLMPGDTIIIELWPCKYDAPCRVKKLQSSRDHHCAECFSHGDFAASGIR